MSASPAIARIGGHAFARTAAVGRVAPAQRLEKPIPGAARQSQPGTGADTATISVAALQYQLGELRSQIERVSASCSTCDPNRVTLLAPLYSKAETLQSLISSANAGQ